MNDNTKQNDSEHAEGQSRLNDGLCQTRSRKDALWRVYTGQSISHLAGVAMLLSSHGLIFFNKKWTSSNWSLTKKGKELLFTWMPELDDVRHNVK